MSAHHADVMLHIKEEMNSQARSALLSSLRDMDGTKEVIYHEGKSHLVIVEYDPVETHSIDFIEEAKAQGYTGHLVGL